MLGITAELRVDDEAVAAQLRRILGPCSGGGAPDLVLAVRSRDGAFVVYEDGAAVVETPFPGPAIDATLSRLTRRVAQGATDVATLHAAAVASGGRGVVLPGSTGAGKSTLAAGLAANGCAYLSDEVAAVGLADGDLRAVPKPLSLETSSWFVADGDPDAEETGRPAFGKWHLAPDRLQGGVVRTCDPALVVFPRYTKRDAPGLTRLEGRDCLLRLVENSFNLRVVGAAGFRRLAALARRCPAYLLVFEDLGEAVDQVGRLLDQAEAASDGEAHGEPQQETWCGPHLTAEPMADELVLYDSRTEVVHVLNPAAALAWARFDGITPLVEVARALADDVGGDPDVVHRDLAMLVDQLAHQGLIEADEAWAAHGR